MYTVYVYEFDLDNERVNQAWHSVEPFWPRAWLSIRVGTARIHVDSRLDCWLFFDLKWHQEASAVVAEQYI